MDKGGDGVKRQQRNTLILALVLLAALGAAFLVQRLWFSGGGSTAVVRIDGQADRALDLSENQEFWVGDEKTGRNLIRVKDGAVMVAEADCPDKICVRTGPIRQAGEVITCLPHKVIVCIPQRGT